VLLMGSFRRTAGDDRIGGLGFACQSLVESELADGIDFVRIDSTITSIRSRAWLGRLPAAAWRMTRCLWHLGPGGVTRALCFASHGSSFAEKGVLILAGSLLGRRMLLFPRSGHLVGQVQRSPIFRRFVQWVLRRSHRVICQSESWRIYFRGLVEPEHTDKFIVVENWLPASSFIAPSASVARSMSPDLFVVAFFNRIEPEKGVHDFIDAVVLAHASDPRITGVIHGDGAALEDVQKRLADIPSGCITYGGWLDGDGKREALRAADAYLFVSHAEGFPNSLLEVLALKLPTVSVRVGAVADVLEDGTSALLADVGDVALLARHLLSLAADRGLGERLAEAAYERVSRENGLPSAIAKLRQVLT